MWSRPVPDAHRELPPLRARLASALRVPDSSTGTSEEAAAEPTPEKFVNQETVENIASASPVARIAKHDPEPTAVALKGLALLLSRIESGQMTPSLGTLEKISEALNVGLNRFFIPESDGEALLEDPFIQGCVRSCGNWIGNNGSPS